MVPKANSVDTKKPYLDGAITRLLIRRRKTTQSEIARELRIPDSTLSYLLDGRFAIKRPLLAALAETLGTSPESIVLPSKKMVRHA